MLLRLHSHELGLTAVTVMLFAFFSIFARYFLTLANVYDMARVATFTLIVAVGVTFVFVAGELDLSVGANVALSTVAMAIAVTDWRVSPWLAAAIAVGVGTTIGAVNGLITAVVGIPSFIATLGMMSVLGGLSLVITAGIPVAYPDQLRSSLFSVTNGHLSQVPVQVIWGGSAFVIGAVLLKFTVFGYHVYAVGGNREGARASGIFTWRVRFLCFLLTGVLCGVTAALDGGWLREGDPSDGGSFTLQVIAAVILGGVALTGGAGSVYGTLLGTSIIAILTNGLVLIGVNANWNQFFIGLIIIIVAALKLLLAPVSRSRQPNWLQSLVGRTREPRGGGPERQQAAA